MASGAWGSWLHWTCSKEAREVNAGAQLAFFFHSVPNPYHGMEPSMSRVGLFISTQSRNYLIDIPRGVSMGILNLIRLTTKISHHKLKPSHRGKAFTKCWDESSRQTARYIPTLKISKRMGNQKARLCCLVTSVETKVIAGFCYCLTQETDGSWQNKPNILE